MKKVITYGTFDLFHQGHYNILKRAKEYGDYLIVGVTSESYDIERGKLSVHDSLTKRIENVMKTGFVDEVIIEEYVGQKIRDVIKYDIDTFVIGDDWKGKFDHLESYCNVVYLERTKNISSTQIRENNNNIFRIGIIAEKEADFSFIDEVKYVSGLHIQSILTSDEQFGQELCDNYSINSYYTDFTQFTKDIDIVIITTNLNERYKWTKKCIQLGKHVICQIPITLQESKMEELEKLAKINRVALIENLTTVYLRAFTQLLWMAKGDILGKLLSIKCVISDDNFIKDKSILDMMSLCVAMIVKFQGADYQNMLPRIPEKQSPKKYYNITFLTNGTVGNIEVGKGIELENELVIVGEKATIVAKEDWWNTGYFEVKQYGEKFVKRYSYNFEGNGFRYILQELLIMLRDNRYECTRLFAEESLAIIHLLNTIFNFKGDSENDIM